ncbi:MAG TPA: S9 family peptidase [Williamwhitmania sp.]|nr:S9 family peptidase [Williamwhitmania sp.]
MKKTLLALSFAAIGLTTMAQEKVIVPELLHMGPVELKNPVFSDVKNTDGKAFEVQMFLKTDDFKADESTPRAGASIGENLKWETLKADTAGWVTLTNTVGTTLHTFAFYIEPNRFFKGKLSIQTPNRVEVYLDGKKVADKSSAEKEADKSKPVDASLTLEKEKYLVEVKLLSTPSDSNSIALKAVLTPNKEFDASAVAISILPERPITLNDVIGAEQISSISISPSGQYGIVRYATFGPKGKSSSRIEVLEVPSKKLVWSIRESKLGSVGWTSVDNTLYYTTTIDKTTNLFTLDLNTMKEVQVAQGIEEAKNFIWAPDNSYALYYQTEKDGSKEEGYKYFNSIEDRWPNWRDRLFLYKLDTKTGISERLTYGNETTGLEDVSLNGKNILVSTTKPDYTQQPFALNSIYQINLETLAVDTIIKNNRYDLSASYSPSGDKLLVLAGPSAFGKIGENVKKGQVANNFDTQAYIFDLKTKTVEPLTRDFNPMIMSGFWNPSNGNIYFQCEDGEYQDLYEYNTSTKKFTKVDTKEDNLLSISYSKTGNYATYAAQGTNSPTKAYFLNLTNGQNQLVANPYKWLNDVALSKVDSWDFKNKRGETIVGRVYYPPSFDSSKKYPVIVYYYGGTSPVGRRWEGRYPFQYYAANGYLVYVLQPAGTTGFGQEFSAMHVNAWGKYTADDIIEGTQKFLASHPYANAKKVGCIGASYGGFMTMYLQTQTDMFTAAISHAGISNIASYWGEGFWGYSYSTVASYNSYPWNNPDLYVKQSPLFMANRIKTPLLLLQGSADTNVPPGESIQMFNALKILGKPVEMVHFDDENHFIIDFDHRTRWTKTIIAWFDRYLKDQPEWWNDLYPPKNF